MSRVTIHSGMSLREAVYLAGCLGVQVIYPPATGEVLFIHPLGRVRANGRRKDASREITVLLRRVADAQGLGEDVRCNPDLSPDGLPTANSEAPWGVIAAVVGVGAGILLLGSWAFGSRRTGTSVPSPSPTPAPAAPRPTTPAGPSPVAVPVPPPTIAATPPPVSTTDPRCAGIPGATGRWSTNLNRCACPTNQTMQNSGRADQYCGCTPPQRLVGDTCQSAPAEAARCTARQVTDAQGACVDLPYDLNGVYVATAHASIPLESDECSPRLPGELRSIPIRTGTEYIYKREGSGYRVCVPPPAGGGVATWLSCVIPALPASDLPGELFTARSRRIRFSRPMIAVGSQGDWQRQVTRTTVAAHASINIRKWVGGSSLAEIEAESHPNRVLYMRVTPADLLNVESPAGALDDDALDLLLG